MSVAKEAWRMAIEHEYFGRKREHFERFGRSPRGRLWIRAARLPRWMPGRARLLKRLWVAPP